MRKGGPESANTLPKKKPKDCRGNRAEKKGHSTETFLIVSVNTILEVVNKRKLTAVVYLDVSKAFDSINHSILLQKLKAIWLAPSAVSCLTATCLKDLKRFPLMLRCRMLYQWCVECHKVACLEPCYSVST